MARQSERPAGAVLTDRKSGAKTKQGRPFPVSPCLFHPLSRMALWRGKLIKNPVRGPQRSLSIMILIIKKVSTQRSSAPHQESRRRSPLRRSSFRRTSPLRRGSPARRLPLRLSTSTCSVAARRAQILRPGPARLSSRRRVLDPCRRLSLRRSSGPESSIDLTLPPDDVPRPTYG